MSRRTGWITSTEQLTRCLPDIGAGPLAVDTEGDSFHHYPEKVCLIQLSFGDRDVLVDPLADLDPAPLSAVFANREIRKILHGADYDLRVLDRDFGLRIHGLFDTMIAARLVGETAFGLAALLERHLGVRVDKRFQRADWSLRPMPAEMQNYAVSDTRHLEELAGLLEKQLETLGRLAWAAEEFVRMEGVRWSQAGDDPDAFFKMKRARGASPRQWAIVRELVRFRERLARSRDRPPFRIFSDEALVAVVQRAPRRQDQLHDVPRLPRSFFSGRSADELLEAVERGLAVPEGELPQPKRVPRQRFSSEFEARVKKLAGKRNEVAAKVRLEPSLIAPKSVLVELQRRLDEGLSIDWLPDLRRWQADLLLPTILDSSG